MPSVPANLRRLRLSKRVIVANKRGYQAGFDASAVEFFHRLTKRKQRRVLDRAHELASDPFLFPDFKPTDEAGR
jgi:hypothetical protein